jgi:hypothetical protein
MTKRNYGLQDEYRRTFSDVLIYATDELLFLFMPSLVPIFMLLIGLWMSVIISVTLVAVIVIMAIRFSPIIPRIPVSNNASTQKN